MVNNLPAMQGTWVRSLGWEDPLKKGTATHSSILAWKIPRTKEPGRLQTMGLPRVGHDWATFTSVFWTLPFYMYGWEAVAFWELQYSWIGDPYWPWVSFTKQLTSLYCVSIISGGKAMGMSWQQHLLLVHHLFRPIEAGHGPRGLGRLSFSLSSGCARWRSHYYSGLEKKPRMSGGNKRMREQDTGSQLVIRAHYSLWALFPDALHFSVCSHVLHPFTGGGGAAQGFNIPA